jgi:hypothetical protein
MELGFNHLTCYGCGSHFGFFPKLLWGPGSLKALVLPKMIFCTRMCEADFRARESDAYEKQYKRETHRDRTDASVALIWLDSR